jgi:hypothetical protein
MVISKVADAVNVSKLTIAPVVLLSLCFIRLSSVCAYYRAFQLQCRNRASFQDFRSSAIFGKKLAEPHSNYCY